MSVYNSEKWVHMLDKKCTTQTCSEHKTLYIQTRFDMDCFRQTGVWTGVCVLLSDRCLDRCVCVCQTGVCVLLPVMCLDRCVCFCLSCVWTGVCAFVRQVFGQVCVLSSDRCLDRCVCFCQTSVWTGVCAFVRQVCVCFCLSCVCVLLSVMCLDRCVFFCQSCVWTGVCAFVRQVFGQVCVLFSVLVRCFATRLIISHH